jgi:DNA recombination-dependent growth factor C
MIKNATIYKITPLSFDVLEQQKQNGVNPGEFDGSMAIVIGEFRPLIASLVSALGGFPQYQPV